MLRLVRLKAWRDRGETMSLAGEEKRRRDRRAANQRDLFDV